MRMGENLKFLSHPHHHISQISPILLMFLTPLLYLSLPRDILANNQYENSVYNNYEII